MKKILLTFPLLLLVAALFAGSVSTWQVAAGDIHNGCIVKKIELGLYRCIYHSIDTGGSALPQCERGNQQQCI